jgi:hypothetical protein
MREYKGSRKAKLHITVGLVFSSVAAVAAPAFAAEATLVGLFVNLVWVWEG